MERVRTLLGFFQGPRPAAEQRCVQTRQCRGTVGEKGTRRVEDAWSFFSRPDEWRERPCPQCDEYLWFVTAVLVKDLQGNKSKRPRFKVPCFVTNPTESRPKGPCIEL